VTNEIGVTDGSIPPNPCYTILSHPDPNSIRSALSLPREESRKHLCLARKYKSGGGWNVLPCKVRPDITTIVARYERWIESWPMLWTREDSVLAIVEWFPGRSGYRRAGSIRPMWNINRLARSRKSFDEPLLITMKSWQTWGLLVVRRVRYYSWQIVPQCVSFSPRRSSLSDSSLSFEFPSCSHHLTPFLNLPQQHCQTGRTPRMTTRIRYRLERMRGVGSRDMRCLVSNTSWATK